MGGTIVSNRFSYAYAEPSDRWNFCTIDVDLSCSKPTVELSLVTMPAPPGAEWTHGPRAKPAGLLALPYEPAFKESITKPRKQSRMTEEIGNILPPPPQLTPVEVEASIESKTVVGSLDDQDRTASLR